MSRLTSVSLRFSLVVLVLCASSCALFGDTREREAQRGPPPSATPTTTASDAVTVFISADMRGYLAPCGCSENMRGGIARAAHQVLEACRQNDAVFYFDGGDSLFPSAELSERQIPQEERKAQALAQAFALMKLQARAVGERDRARGDAFRESLGLPHVPMGEARVFAPAGADGQKIGVAVGNDLETLGAAARKARAEGARFVIGLFYGTLAEAGVLSGSEALAAELDLLVPSKAEQELEGEDNRLVRGLVPIARVQSKGRSLMRVDVTFGAADAARDDRFELLTSGDEAAQALETMQQRIELLEKQINQPGLTEDARRLRREKLGELVKRREALASERAPAPQDQNAFSVRFIALDAVLPSAPEGREIVERYDRDVGRINLAWAKAHGEECPPPAAKEAGYVGNDTCLACHPQTRAVYEQTKHAHAYGTLEKLGKQYHLDCVGCHVTGWQRPGGVCRVDQVEGREHVGCESCHGPGSLHVTQPAKGTIRLADSPQACVGCHDPENSPHFDFAAYLPVILGPGHGRPLKSIDQ